VVNPLNTMRLSQARLFFDARDGEQVEQPRTEFIAFVHNCTVYDLQDGTIDPAALMIATARANATASVNSRFPTKGKIAEQALPLVRNVIEAVI